MTYLTNSAEGGTSGNAATQGAGGNTGGASGSYLDVVNVGAGGTLTFDNTQAAHGALSYNITTGATARQVWVEWTSQLGGTPATLWFRVYAFFTADPLTICPLVRLLTSAGTTCGRLAVQTGGKLEFRDGALVVRLTSTNVIPVGAWFRVEGFCTGSASAGQLEFKLFNTPDSFVPTETQTSGAALNTTGPIGQMQVGQTAIVAANINFWIDDLGASDAGYIGPAVPLQSVVVVTTQSVQRAAAY